MGALDKNKNLEGRTLIGTRATNSLGFTIPSQNVQQMAGDRISTTGKSNFSTFYHLDTRC